MAKHQRKNRREQLVTKSEQSSRKRRKLIRNIAIIVAVAIILGVAGWGFNYYQNRPYRQLVIRFNGVTLDMRYFINTAKLYYGNAPAETTISQFADFVEQQIERNETIIQGSKLLGVEIKRSDIESELKKAGKKVSREQVDVLMAQELVSKQVPTIQPQYHVEALLSEDETAAQAAIARIQGGEAFDKVADSLSRVSRGGMSNSDLGWVTSRQANILMNSTRFGDIISGVDAGTLSGPVYDDSTSKQFGYWVLKATEKNDVNNPTDNTTMPEIHVQGILVGSTQDANDVISKLNAGADINDLAKLLSQYPTANTTGSDLGWATKSSTTSDVEELFNTPLNTIVGPVSDNQSITRGGYWVFNVLEKNTGLLLTTNQQNQLTQDLLNRCTEQLKKNPDFKADNLLTQEMKDLALNKVVLAQGEGSVLISTSSLPQAELGASYYQKIETYGATKGNIWSITTGSLPEGLSLDKKTGVISGTPKFAGGSSFTVQVSNTIHYSVQDFFMNIRLALSITTTSLPDGQVGTDYSQTIEVFENGYAYTWSIINGKLPDGLSLNANTGEISGKPATAGTYGFTVQIDDNLKKATQDLSIRIQ